MCNAEFLLGSSVEVDSEAQEYRCATGVTAEVDMNCLAVPLFQLRVYHHITACSNIAHASKCAWSLLILFHSYHHSAVNVERLRQMEFV